MLHSVNSPDHAYGVGKLTAEHLCALYSGEFGFEAIVARCFAFMGLLCVPILSRMILRIGF
jgi:nucleoside-diphosphate-sugar epimerase